jgi:DNA-binding PadR family transcriptional regulator
MLKGDASDLNQREIYPYIVFLPPEEKYWILKTVFGSKVPMDILKFSIKQKISNKIYQKDLVKTLPYSNKTIIEHLKTLTKRGILRENMEKNENSGRAVWVKYYLLSDLGKWFALLLAEKPDLTEAEKTEIFCSILKSYMKWVKEISQTLGVSKKIIHEIFNKEMK